MGAPQDTLIVRTLSLTPTLTVCGFRQNALPLGWGSSQRAVLTVSLRRKENCEPFRTLRSA